MITIRLSRTGVKRRPFYHIVVADSRRARDGRYLERLGYYNPIAEARETIFTLDRERFDYWRSKGAQVSSRMAYLTKSGTFEKLKQKAVARSNQIQYQINKEATPHPSAKTTSKPETSDVILSVEASHETKNPEPKAEASNADTEVKAKPKKASKNPAKNENTTE